MAGIKTFLWWTGVTFVASGVLGVIAAVIVVESRMDLEIPSSVLSAIATTGAVVFLIGAFIVWAFSFRFFLAHYQRLSLTRGIAYLLLILVTTWISPFVLLAIEGRQRFFS